MPQGLAQLDPPPDLVDRAYSALRDAISEGTLAPGQRLTQEEIAAKLAVSRQPVLQALRLLKADRFVEDAPGRGVQVAPLDARWIEEVYAVRSALDAQAARLAARRVAARRAADTRRPAPAVAAAAPVIEPRLIETGRKAARGRSVYAMIEADLAFHNAIYAAAANPLLAQTAQQHWRHIRRAMGAVLQTSSLRASVWDEHEAIARAIESGDAEAAAQLMLAHGDRAALHLARRLEAEPPAT
ncbi:MAG: GntR family transcriptional regulator [Ideonella sp.]|jgi:DNA-binding GntR family transcriptional regulator|nr:GntR family transcriptional regulator [Ideonella sp.]